MRISAILPVFNGGRLLAEAVASIKTQSRQPDEIILVDDGSTDGAVEEILRNDPTICCIRQTKSGCASARNTGLRNSSGEWVAFLDADDLWPSDALEKHFLCLQEHPEARIIGGVTQVMRLAATDQFVLTDFRRPLLSLTSKLIDRTVFSEVGFFRDHLRQCSDFDWFVRAQEVGIVVTWHEGLGCYYRHHSAGLTGDMRSQRLSQVNVIRDALNRRHPLREKSR